MARFPKCLGVPAVSVLLAAGGIGGSPVSLDEVGEVVDRKDLGRFWGVVLVRVGGEDVFARGYGFEDERLRPIEPGVSLFDAGSIAKSVTAAAVLRLVDEDKLQLETTLGEVFGESAGTLADVTVASLLAHRSGIGFEAERKLDSQAMASADSLVRAIGTVELGEAIYQYSNIGYFLAAAVVERISGQPFEDAVRGLVFEPAGISPVGFVGDRSVQGARSTVRRRMPPAHQPWNPVERFDIFDYPWNWSQRGATGVLFTASSLADWFEAVADGGWISASSRDTMLTPGPGGYGLGVFVDRDTDGTATRFSHSGSTGGYEAHAAHYPLAFDGAGATVVVLTMQTGGAEEIGAAVRRIVAPEPAKPLFVGVYLGRHADLEEDGVYRISDNIDWRVLARYVGSENGRRIVDNRPTITLVDSERGIWPLMIRLDADRAKALIEEFNATGQQIANDPAGGQTRWSKGVTLIADVRRFAVGEHGQVLLDGDAEVTVRVENHHQVLVVTRSSTGDELAKVMMGGAESRRLQQGLAEAMK